ncbi:MAG TPA: hypothetical protein VEA37_05650, partial [Flavobacterium sp.]|nr:hypothetical protein [Flavobacterium sp.]
MKRLIPITFLLLSLPLFSQQIKNGTAFIIQFNDPESSLDFEIVSQKPFDDIIDSSEMDDIFKEE